MDSTRDDEPADELLELTRQLRGQLRRHASLGAWAAPGSPSSRPEGSGITMPPSEIVLGVGAEDAPLLFVGEAPGEHANPAGELLGKMIEAMGWTRHSVHIVASLDERPRRVAPQIIVALGAAAANQILGVHTPISALRGAFHDRNGVKVMPTFHPSDLLREPDRKRDTWADLKLVMAELERLGIAPPNR